MKKKQISYLLLPIFFLLRLTDSQHCLSQNCLSCQSPSQCQTCQPGLSCCQLQCIECITTVCKYCMSEYTLNVESGLCELTNSCQQPTCVSCLQSYCSLCIQGYVLRTDSYYCQKCPPLCNQCDVFGTCFSCYPGYFVGVSGQCENCNLPNCIRCQNQNICLQCQAGFAVDQQLQPFCTLCTSNCLYCAYPSACILCLPNYYLTSNYKCSPCSSSCQTCYQSPTNCTLCQVDKYLFNNQCVYCQLVVPFCVTCLNIGQFQCLNCSRGMYVGEAGMKCQLCPQGCVTCANESICYICLNGYYLNQSTMLCLSCQIQNCVFCANSSYCEDCMPFYHQSSSGESCFQCMPNCLSCILTKNKAVNCKLCINGYILIDSNMCVACPVNCLFCSNPTTCTQCFNGFYIAQTQGKSICMPCPQYCPVCASQSICINCPPGTFNLDNTCITSILDNCFNVSLISGNYVCKACFSGYYLTSSGSCNQCINNCQICNSSNGCQMCSQGYFISDQACAACSSNCISCLSLTHCLNCSTTYYINNLMNSCYKCPNGCTQCTSAVTCQSCQSGYYLSVFNNSLEITVCLKCKQGCLMCQSSDQCTECMPLYGFNREGQCQQCSIGCLYCNSLHGCQTCAEGYALIFNNVSNISCSQCSSNCINCISVLNFKLKTSTVKCQQCSFGYQLLTTGQCFKCGSSSQTLGCQNCDSNGGCMSCYPNYNLQNGVCVNVNKINKDEPDWPLIGTTIGLGCLSMLLLIIILYQKLGKNKLTGLSVQK